MTGDETNQYLYDLRQRIRANTEAGRDPEEGIDDKDLQQVISILRGSRALMEARKVSRAKVKAQPMSDEDLAKLFS